MKDLVFILFFISTASLAQMPIDSETKRFMYREVVEVPNVNQSELYTRAREWFAITYNSANDVIQMDDKESGKLIGKGIIKIIHTMNKPRNVEHTVTIEVKDNRFRYTITNFYMDWIDHRELNRPFENMQKVYQKKIYERTHEEVSAMIESMKTSMRQTNSDW